MLTLRTHATLHDFSAAEWDSMAADDNPFVSYGFLSGLEQHGCIRDRNDRGTVDDDAIVATRKT